MEARSPKMFQWKKEFQNLEKIVSLSLESYSAWYHISGPKKTWKGKNNNFFFNTELPKLNFNLPSQIVTS